VSDLYQSPFTFTGTLNKIEINIAPTNLAAEDRKQIDKANESVAAAAEDAINARASDAQVPRDERRDMDDALSAPRGLKRGRI
jgi:hypothetical protein